MFNHFSPTFLYFLREVRMAQVLYMCKKVPLLQEVRLFKSKNQGRLRFNELLSLYEYGRNEVEASSKVLG